MLAAIDIGTNTFRLLIAKIHFNPGDNKYSIKEIYSERVITRLGEGIHEKKLLKKEAIDRSIQSLKKFSNVISRYNVHKTAAIATSALREAVNGTEFIEKVLKETGLDIKIISGEEEAIMTTSGMLMDLTIPESALMIDIGGGSTELIFLKNNNTNLSPGYLAHPVLIRSLNLGVVYLADRYMKNDPPTKHDLSMMGTDILQGISSVAESFTKYFSAGTAFIGTAGTITTLAAIAQGLTEFEHDKIHNFKLSRDQVENIFSTISVLTSKERAKYIPFEPARLDIIVPGTLILLKLMEIFGFKVLTVSNYGLREGILLDLFKRECQ
jgi:exopolyphosphatase/guanosine-5'-triphosphate,3'-diphosphate pyrophosphatase